RAHARRDSRAAVGAMGVPPRQGECLMYKSLGDAIRDAEAQGITLSQLALELEAKDQGRTVADIRSARRGAWVLVRDAVDKGMPGDLFSESGLVGGDAAKLRTGPAGPLAG